MKKIIVTPERAVELVNAIYKWSQTLNDLDTTEYHKGYSSAQKSLEEIIEYDISRFGNSDVIQYGTTETRIKDAFKALDIDVPYGGDAAIIIFQHDGDWIIQKVLKDSLIPRLNFPPRPL